MASKRNSMSDERIGKALINGVIQDELQEILLEDSCRSPLLEVDPMTEEEESTAAKVKRMFNIIYDKVKDDEEFQGLADSMSGDISCWDAFRELSDRVFRDGINFTAVVVFIFLAVRLFGKWVRQKAGNFLQLIRDFLQWIVDFFRDRLLGFIQECGGWIQSLLSEQQSSMYKYL